jgi:hypothetical protein
VTAYEYRGTLGRDDENILKLIIIAQLYDYAKKIELYTVYFK